MVVWHLKQIGKVKKLKKWVPHELTANRKIIFLKCHRLLFYATTNHFSIRLWHATKSEFHTTGNDQLSSWTNKKLQRSFQSQTCNKKVTVWWPTADPVHYSFLNPGKTIICEKYAPQISEMHQKLQHLQPALGNRKGPILLHDNAQQHVSPPALQKLNESDYEVLHHLPLLTWHLTNWLPLLQASRLHFAGKDFHSQQEAENAFQEFIESPGVGFYTVGINKLISHWQKYVDCNGSYFD